MQKTLSAESAGAVAVVITDNDSSSPYIIDMGPDNTGRETSIPSVSLQWKDGYMIKKSIENHNLKAATINIPLNLTLNSQKVLRRAPWAYW